MSLNAVTNGPAVLIYEHGEPRWNDMDREKPIALIYVLVFVIMVTA
jgi:hypothetical protein